MKLDFEQGEGWVEVPDVLTIAAYTSYFAALQAFAKTHENAPRVGQLYHAALTLVAAGEFTHRGITRLVTESKDTAPLWACAQVGMIVEKWVASEFAPPDPN